jgi:hypothetical protein
MSIGFTLDRSKLDDQRRKMEQIFYKKLSTMKIEAEQKTKLITMRACVSLLLNTMPSERSGIGKAIANIKHDFRSIYQTPGDVYESIKSSDGPRIAGAFYAASKKGDTARAESILRMSSSPLNNLRFGHAINQDGKEIRTYAPAIISDAEMKAFLKLVVARLGKTASGWAACIEKLGYNGNGVKWKGTAVHGTDGGNVNVIHDKLKVTYRVVNLRPLARKLLNPSDLARIMREAREDLTRELNRR